jgi:hypothetical protein
VTVMTHDATVTVNAGDGNTLFEKEYQTSYDNEATKTRRFQN